MALKMLRNAKSQATNKEWDKIVEACHNLAGGKICSTSLGHFYKNSPVEVRRTGGSADRRQGVGVDLRVNLVLRTYPILRLDFLRPLLGQY